MRVTKILSYQNPSVGFHLQVKHKHLPLRDVKLLSRDSIYKAGGGGGGLLSYKRLLGICRLTGSQFHDWSDYNGVTFSKELLELGRKFLDFWGK